MRDGCAAFAIALVLFVSPRIGAADRVRFADIQFRLLAVGEHQATQEVGSFQASLPLGTPGRLQRAVSITNQTRGAAQKLTLDLTLTPLLGEDRTLHCMVLSDATPEGGGVVSRARDLAFVHPGDQLMELFADAPTGIHLVMALQVALPGEDGSASKPCWPHLRFTVKVERWDGSERTIVDTIQLSSEEGVPVGHRYEQRIPRWVEAEEAEKAGAQDFLRKLPVIDPKAEKTIVNTREGFSILQNTPGKPKVPTGADAAKPAEGVTPSHAPKAEKSLIWVQEWMELSISPVEMKEGALSFQVVASGEFLDPRKNQAESLGRIETTRTARPMEPASFYLTHEQAGGPHGYVIWVVPEW